MPEKSIREMSRLERQHHSLSARVFHTTIMASLVLGFVSLLIGLTLYLYSQVGQYTAEAFNLSKSAALILEKVADPGSFSGEVLQIYDGMDEARRQELGTPAYRERFLELENRQELQTMLAVLDDFRTTGDVNDIYLAMYVRDPARLVYVADPETAPGAVRRVGDWEAVQKRESDRFLDLKWSRHGRLFDIGRTAEYGWMCTAGVPVLDKDGEVAAFVLADVTLAEIGQTIKDFVISFVVAMALVTAVIGALVTRHMKKTLVEPINEIAGAAQNYVRDKQAGVQITDHFAMLNIRTGDEVENLSLVMADMERELSEFEENLTRAVAEKERIGTELELAQRIQADTLPNTFPPFPERTDFDIYAEMTPAKEVGGDFYDFFLIDEDHLGLVMADVSGKGVPAALFMMISKILVQNHALMGCSPGKVLETVNAQICSNNREEMFITVWLGILDTRSGVLTASNAGHEYPILKRPGGEFELVKDKHGFVIGGMDGVLYQEYELKLEPGSKLFLYTDGVPEATNASNEMFGMERTLKALHEVAEEEPRAILRKIRETVDLFVGGAEKFDDLTMLCLEYNGQKEEGGRAVKELNIEAKVANIPVVTDFLDAALEEAGCPTKTLLQIDVAIDEIFTNIAQYAYEPGTGNATVRFEMEEPNTAVITFIDSGMAFDPTAKEDPDVSLSAEERQIGGLGIFMVKKTMDGMYYERRDGQNILQIRKTI